MGREKNQSETESLSMDICITSGVESKKTSQFLSKKPQKTSNSSFYVKILNGRLISIEKGNRTRPELLHFIIFFPLNSSV